MIYDKVIFIIDIINILVFVCNSLYCIICIKLINKTCHKYCSCISSYIILNKINLNHKFIFIIDSMHSHFIIYVHICVYKNVYMCIHIKKCNNS